VCLAHSWPMSSSMASTQALALPPGRLDLRPEPDSRPADSGQAWPTHDLELGKPVPSITVKVP
jgi:hypothetical protein